MSSTSDESQTRRRRRRMSRCCGLYSLMTPHNSVEHHRRTANEAKGKTVTVPEARGVFRAFATNTKIHGVRSIYRAEG